MEVYSEEVLTLKERVKAGNSKLNLAWEQICRIDHNTQEWKDAMEQWHQANVKLSGLCTRLELLGYTDCLYLDAEGKKAIKCSEMGKLGCRVCPCSPDKAYWEKELFDDK